MTSEFWHTYTFFHSSILTRLKMELFILFFFFFLKIFPFFYFFFHFFPLNFFSFFQYGMFFCSNRIPLLHWSSYYTVSSDPPRQLVMPTSDSLPWPSRLPIVVVKGRRFDQRWVVRRTALLPLRWEITVMEYRAWESARVCPIRSLVEHRHRPLALWDIRRIRRTRLISPQCLLPLQPMVLKFLIDRCISRLMIDWLIEYFWLHNCWLIDCSIDYFLSVDWMIDWLIGFFLFSFIVDR